MMRILISLLIIGLSGPLAGQHTEQPNILFILTDDQRWDAIGYHGNEIIRTPEMDRLAGEGVFFTNAFVTTPICAASRASILCGQYERSHGYTFGTPPLDKKLTRKSYATLLRDQGYYTGMIGKVGVNFEKKEEEEMFDVYESISQKNYHRLTGPGSSVHLHLTDHIGDRVSTFLRERPEDQPFCLSVSFHAPHAADANPDQYVWPERYDAMYEDIEIPPPAMSDQQHFAEQPEYVKEGLNYLRWLWRYDTPEKYQQSVKGYYRMISAVDENIGKVRRVLDSLEIADNTIIMLMGDNGYFLGERGFAGKWLMYEPSLRVPLLIFDPRNTQHNEDRDEMVLNIDIAPTILQFAGVKLPNTMQGQSLVPLVHGQDVEWRSTFFCEHLFDHDYIPQSEGIRTEEWKYFRYRQDLQHEELYNLHEDPWEDHNLATDPAFRKQLEEFRQRTDEFIITHSGSGP